MSDDRFRLTALDARRWDFGNALRGYDRARVDEFREQVAEELERMSRTNQELETKVSNFLEQLRVFRDRDKALNEALVSAQQLRGEIRQLAEREAQLVMREAHAEADRIVAAVQGDLRRAEEELQQLWRSRQAFLAQMRTLVERQATELAAAEGAAPPVLTAAETSAARTNASGPLNPTQAFPLPTSAALNPTQAFPIPAVPPARDAASAGGVSPDTDRIGFRLSIDTTTAPPPLSDDDDAVMPPVRPSMPTPSWLDAVVPDEKQS
jgi:DivIVA domain-containing protein